MAANTQIYQVPIIPIYFCNDTTSRTNKYHLDKMMELINTYEKMIPNNNDGSVIHFKINCNYQPNFMKNGGWINGTMYFQNKNYDFDEVASAIAFTVNKFFVGKFYKKNAGDIIADWKEVTYFSTLPY